MIRPIVRFSCIGLMYVCGIAAVCLGLVLIVQVASRDLLYVAGLAASALAAYLFGALAERFEY